MAGIPQNFQAFSNALANYDFVDIASGTGYINFYLGTTVDIKALSNFTYYSDVITETADAGIGAVNASIFDHDYDILLNRPLDLCGVGLVNIGLNGQDANVTTWAVIYLRKWNGSVETDICNNTSRVVTGGGWDITDYTATDLTIPLTHFKKGEYLRLTINVRASNTAGVVRWVRYPHDPMNRTDATSWDATATVPTKLLFQCPVRLNL